MGLGPDCKHRQCIERTLAAIAAEQGTRARGGGYEGQGHAELLTRGEALVAAHELRTGRGQTQAKHTVNAWRAKKGKGPVSRSAMRTSIFKLGVKRYRRCGQKTGNTDPGSKWAIARLAQCEQWSKQLGGVVPEEPPPEAAPTAVTLTLEGHGAVEMQLVDPFSAVGTSILVRNAWWDKALTGSTRCRVAGFTASLSPRLPPKKRKAAASTAAPGPPSYALHWNGQHFAMDAETLLPLLPAAARAAIAAKAAPPVAASTAVAPRIVLEQILWSDQKHSKCVLGCGSKHEYLVPVGPDGEYLHPDAGGVMPARHPTIVPKFAQEARKAYSVMMKEMDGQMRGFKAAPFDYTGTLLVGPKKYATRQANEIADVLTLKSGGFEKFDAAKAVRLPGGRFQMRWPDTWQQELRAACAKSHRGRQAMTSVIEWADHLVAEGDRLFADTPYANTWVIYHDALSQWWEKGTQAHLLALGFPPSRQMCCQGKTNQGTKDDPNRYEGKLVGDSPELDPCDSNLFSYYEVSMSQHIAATCLLDKDDPKRFKVGTPEELSRTMERVWMVSPSSEEIVRDIKRFPTALARIIECKGAKVPELDDRHGRRETKPTVLHSDCDIALAARNEVFASLDPQ